MGGSDELRQRVALLDRLDRLDRLDGEPGDPRAGIERFITVLERVTDSGGPYPVLDAVTADSLVAECRLLRRLNGAVPEIVSGPLRGGPQFWVATGKLGRLAPSRPEPSLFGEFGAGPAAKPARAGLFTSTGVLGGHGMWRTYLDLNSWSTLYPLPWHTWSLTPRPDAAVHEISSAAAWVEFVRRYPLSHGGLVYPDWRAAARDLDAVHITLRAIAAIQGVRFPTGHGVTAASYWDVETTCWLRWCFTAAELVELVER